MQLRSGNSHIVNDPLHVRAVAFTNGDGRAVITLVDAIGISREDCDEAKAVAAAETGWRMEEMLIAATHAHTTPSTGRDTPGSKDFRAKRQKGLSDAIIQAIENLEPAQVGYAAEDEPTEVRNRRWFMEEGEMPQNPFGTYDQVKMNPNPTHITKPAGPIDPEVCVVDVRTRKGRGLVLIANYSLHYVGGMPKHIVDGKEMGVCSADYFGEFARIMPFRYPGSQREDDMVAMMTNGTSGDINNLDFARTRSPRAPFEQVQIVASKTADAAWKAIGKIEDYNQEAVVRMLQREVTLKYRSVTPKEVAYAEEILAVPKKDADTLPFKALQYANSALRYQEPDRTEDVIVQAIRIGDQAIVSLPFEVLVEIGLEIKEKSPTPHTFTIELANGSYGYLPTPKQHELGGYETWIGTCRVEKDSSVILTRNLLEMLDELWQE